MALLLALAVAATALMAQPGQLACAARASPAAAEAFWRAALPDTPVPEAILELLHHRESDVANGVDEDNVDGKDPKPPMNFNYDDYRAFARSAPIPLIYDIYNGDLVRKAASGDDSAAAPSTSTLFFLEDAVRAGESLPFHSSDLADAGATAVDGPPLKLYTVRSVSAVDGSRFVVCRRGAVKPAAVHGCRATGPAKAYILTLQAGGEGEVGATITAAAVCRTVTSPRDPEHAALRLLGVEPTGGATAVVCHAIPDAQVLPVAVVPAKKNTSAN